MRKQVPEFRVHDEHARSVDLNLPIGGGVEAEFSVDRDTGEVTFWGFNVNGEANCSAACGSILPDSAFNEAARFQAGVRL